MGSAVLFLVLLSAFNALWIPCVWSQTVPERNALCSEDGCFVVYFQRKTFLEAWRSCKEKGGNLATMKRPVEARQVEELLAGAERKGSRAKVRVWIGLQRQPRQCSATRPLRGFSWTTGDHDTQYTNWLREDSPSTCSAPRCVVTTHSTASHEAQDNYKWLDGSCSLPVDGFLCRFIYEKGMCQPIPSEGGDVAVLYSTPFHLHSTRLTHVPFGSMATVPCPGGTKGDQSILCVPKEDGRAGWHQDGPFCTDPPPKSWCQEDNGGCEQLCFDADDHYYCECHREFRLAEDGHTCVPSNPCQDARCEYECVPSAEGYHCTCPNGYQLAPDRVTCQDKDECLNVPCEQACENSLGSYMCHCHLGFFPLPEDPTRCQDIDECQIPGSCEHMCVNYIGGFQCHCREGFELQLDYSSCRSVSNANESPTVTPSLPWVSSLPENGWFPQVPDQLPQLPEGDWPTETIPQDWLTDPPHLEGLLTDLTDVPLEQQWEEQEEHNWPVKQEEQEKQEEQDRQEDADRQEEQLRQEEENTREEWDRSEEQYRQEEDTQEEQRVHIMQEEDVLVEYEDPNWSNDKITQSWVSLDWTEQDKQTLATSPSVTSTPDWFEEESTASPTAPLTSQPGEDAWYSLWAPEESIDQGETPAPWAEEGSQSEFGNRETTPSWYLTTGPFGNEYDAGLDALTPEPGTDGPPEKDSSKQQSNMWLLIALLVPLCIFVVVMVALGIVYCTRCTARARNKNNKDCYHWISGASDKPGSPGAAKA